MEIIKFTYGENVDLYKDVLRVTSVASDQEIQSAFVARRYELFNQLQNASNSRPPKQSPNGKLITDMTERKFTEKKMDALIKTYRLLSDAVKRKQYNMSLSLHAINEKKKQVFTSPSGVSGFKDLSSLTKSSNAQINESLGSASSKNSEPFDEFDDSRELATSYSNPNQGPSFLTKHINVNVKKKLFDSFETNASGKEQGILRKNSRKSRSNRCGSTNSIQSFSDTDGSSYIEGSSIEGENSLEGFDGYEDSMRRKKRELENQKRHHISKTSQTQDGGSPDRKVRWSKSAEDNSTKQGKRKNKKKTPRRRLSENDEENVDSVFSSWLRSNDLTDQADMLDDLGKEIAGVASDTFLAFSQVLNAFTIDEEVIDSVASNVAGATEELGGLKR